ncbi:hypothetical protein [Reyranella sp.]|uniref:hypothetical protein n=1 Tax=Reyranella sp. TaxID=1929291 RepID=UPI003BA93080
MGGLVSDSATRDVIAQINARFEAGDAIAEAAALQKKFKVFSKEHSLYDSWLVLGIRASDPPERTRWKKWTEVTLRGYPSDIDALDGHDRLVKAFQENLESDNPLPMFYKHHLIADDKRVLVSGGQGPYFSLAEHVVMSIPIKQSSG